MTNGLGHRETRSPPRGRRMFRWSLPGAPYTPTEVPRETCATLRSRFDLASQTTARRGRLLRRRAPKSPVRPDRIYAMIPAPDACAPKAEASSAPPTDEGVANRHGGPRLGIGPTASARGSRRAKEDRTACPRRGFDPPRRSGQVHATFPARGAG